MWAAGRSSENPVGLAANLRIGLPRLWTRRWALRRDATHRWCLALGRGVTMAPRPGDRGDGPCAEAAACLRAARTVRGTATEPTRQLRRAARLATEYGPAVANRNVGRLLRWSRCGVFLAFPLGTAARPTHGSSRQVDRFPAAVQLSPSGESGRRRAGAVLASWLVQRLRPRDLVAICDDVRCLLVASAAWLAASTEPSRSKKRFLRSSAFGLTCRGAGRLRSTSPVTRVSTQWPTRRSRFRDRGLCQRLLPSRGYSLQASRVARPNGLERRA